MNAGGEIRTDLIREKCDDDGKVADKPEDDGGAVQHQQALRGGVAQSEEENFKQVINKLGLSWAKLSWGNLLKSVQSKKIDEFLKYYYCATKN